jgi:hypothetical protein
MKRIIFPLLSCLLIAAPCQARAEVIDVNRGPNTCDGDRGTCGLVLEIRGQIDASTFNKFKRLVDDTRRRAESQKWYIYPPWVNLNSPGGSVAAAMAIGRILRSEQAHAIVDDNAVCYSACVLVLAGATGRVMGGKIGIHRPYLEVPQQQVTPESVRDLYQKLLQDIRSYFREMNVSEQLADAMLRINPENMRVLNDAQLNAYGLTFDDPIAQETRDLETAQIHNLSRQEFMRRKALAEYRCGVAITLNVIRA